MRWSSGSREALDRAIGLYRGSLLADLSIPVGEQGVEPRHVARDHAGRERDRFAGGRQRLATLERGETQVSTMLHATLLRSDAMALKAGIGAHGLWSISRGLSRGLAGGLKGRQEYRQMMDHADTPRQGDLDGRGNLSQKALVAFSQWFLKVCLDQITFMTGLLELKRSTAASGRLWTAARSSSREPPGW